MAAFVVTINTSMLDTPCHLQVRGHSAALSVTWASFRNTSYRDTRRSTVVSSFSAFISSYLACLLARCQSCFTATSVFYFPFCMSGFQERSHSAVTSATCVLFRSITWKDTRELTVEKSHISVTPANRCVSCTTFNWFCLAVRCSHTCSSFSIFPERTDCWSTSGRVEMPLKTVWMEQSTSWSLQATENTAATESLREMQLRPAANGARQKMLVRGVSENVKSHPGLWEWCIVRGRMVTGCMTSGYQQLHLQLSRAPACTVNMAGLPRWPLRRGTGNPWRRILTPWISPNQEAWSCPQEEAWMASGFF